ncbi:hypothetical protein EJ065_5448 [Corallococcus coralloides]|uniref:Uncharacterized protein n=1 Tax=Corallococcus coralloides TaxID=184914 RepID=A0A410RYQ5_CORCK|nr:hypothetical protein EJ065_5448 [Corallococcus coralloides]
MGEMGPGGCRDLGRRGEGLQHALIASLQQCRQFVLKRPHVALVKDRHHAEGPLAQRLSAHVRQQLGGASHECPLQGLNEEHVPGTRRHPRCLPQQLELRLRAGFPRLPARRVLELEARTPQPVQVEVRGLHAAVRQQLHQHLPLEAEGALQEPPRLRVSRVMQRQTQVLQRQRFIQCHRACLASGALHHQAARRQPSQRLADGAPAHVIAARQLRFRTKLPARVQPPQRDIALELRLHISHESSPFHPHPHSSSQHRHPTTGV